jgi:hypothetical protein
MAFARLRDGCDDGSARLAGRVDSVPGGWYKERVTRAGNFETLNEGGFEQVENFGIALHPPIRPAPASETPEVR